MTRWSERWTRLEAWLESRVRERVTRAGVIYLTALALVGFAAFASANNLLFLMLAAMLATLLVSGFVSRLGISGLELDVHLPEHLSARRPARARVFLRNDKSFVPSFSIHVVGVKDSVFSTPLYFPVVPGGTTLEDSVDVVFRRRGVHREDSFRFSSRFPFGFAERRIQVTMRHDVLVYPALEPQPEFEQLLAEAQGDAEARMRGRGHDFYRIRPYEALESARNVDWKATAHTGALQVREFAREQEHLITVVLDLEAPADAGEWFERAIECSAWMVWRLWQSGARVRFRTQNFDILLPAEGDAYAILKYLAIVEARHSAAPIPPAEEESVPILLSAQPQRLVDAGWVGARLVGRDAFGSNAAAKGTAA